MRTAEDRLVAALPGEPSPEGFAGYLTRLSRDLAGLTRRDDAGLIDLLRGRARVLGLDPDDLAGALGRGLTQAGCLGPDEAAEYRRNLAALLAEVGVPPGEQPGVVQLLAACGELARVTVRALRELPPDRVPVFLGTDAEFLATAYDLMAGRPGAARTFYMSRLSLLSDEERAVLVATRDEVFGPSGVADRTATGIPVGRHAAWMDNGLLASQLFELVREARATAVVTDRPYGEVFVEIFADEWRTGRRQYRRAREGRLTMFGRPHPAVDAVVRRGISDGMFVRRCQDLADRFAAGPGAGPAEPVIVDIGSTGTQPCLLMGALHARTGTAPPVLLYGPGRVSGPPSPAFRPVAVTGRFALAVESVKTFMTDYAGAERNGGHDLAVVPPDHQLLAFLKHLAFHREIASHGDA